MVRASGPSALTMIEGHARHGRGLREHSSSSSRNNNSKYNNISTRSRTNSSGGGRSSKLQLQHRTRSSSLRGTSRLCCRCPEILLLVNTHR
jgi:hypothetical protein